VSQGGAGGADYGPVGDLPSTLYGEEPLWRFYAADLTVGSNWVLETPTGGAQELEYFNAGGDVSLVETAWGTAVSFAGVGAGTYFENTADKTFGVRTGLSGDWAVEIVWRNITGNKGENYTECLSRHDGGYPNEGFVQWTPGSYNGYTSLAYWPGNGPYFSGSVYNTLYHTMYFCEADATGGLGHTRDGSYLGTPGIMDNGRAWEGTNGIAVCKGLHYTGFDGALLYAAFWTKDSWLEYTSNDWGATATSRFNLLPAKS
jgi:hypothetical protein